MNNKLVGYITAALGAILALLAGLADVIGIGNRSGFGWQQTLGVVLGVLAVAAGLWWAMRKPAEKK